jgi:hypothetical protein
MVRWCEGGVNQGLLPMTIIVKKKVIDSVHAIYWIAMKAKGNDQSQAFGTQ